MYDVNLLHSVMPCKRCCREMIIVKRKTVRDGIAWLCKHCASSRTNAIRCMNYISIRKYSFFSKSNFELHKHVKIIYAWSRGLRIAESVDTLDVSPKSLCNYFMALWVVCIHKLESMDTRFGGPDERIEIGETKFKQNTKKGDPDTSVTVFSIVDTTAQVGYMRVVPKNNNPATLFSILQENIVPGTTIHALKPVSFGQLQNACNTSFNFVDLENEKHTNGMLLEERKTTA